MRFILLFQDVERKDFLNLQFISPNMKKTVVLGASSNPQRFSYRMVKNLLKSDFDVVPVGFRQGMIEGKEIITGMPEVEDVHTVLLYLGPERQAEYLDYILSLKPARIIFNPGTYNPRLIRLARKRHIETVTDCSLVMLSQGKL